MDAAAEDDSERRRNKAKLYAPPKGERRNQRGRPPGMRMDRAAAQALAAQFAAEDARLGAGP